MKKTAFVLLIGFVTSFTAFTMVKQWEEEKRQAEYNHRADAHTAALISSFQSIEKQLEDMRFLLEYELNTEQKDLQKPHEFMDKLTPVLTHEPALIDVDWATLEANTKQAHIIYSWKHHQGVEEGIVPLNHQHITAQIVQEEQSEQQILQLITPISNQTNSITTEPLQGEVIAALVSEWDIGRIIEGALKNTPVSAQDIRISNISDGKKVELYFHPSRSRTQDEKDVHTNIQHTSSFSIGGLTMQAEYEAAPKFLRDFPIILAWQTLFIWLAGTILLALYLYRRDRYTEGVEKLVEQRTFDLKQKSSELHRMIDSLQDIYYQIDLDGKVLMVSPSISILGYTVEEVVGTNMSEYCENDDELKKLMLAVGESGEGEVQNHHICLKHFDGSVRWVSLNAQYIYDDKNKVIGFEGTLRDFTASKANREKMEKADKMESLGVMAGGIAHDFNNILTSILGNAYLARIEAKGNASLIEYMSAIEDSGDKAAEICKQMLAYTGQGKYSIQYLNINQIIEDILAMVRSSLPADIQLTFELGNDLPDILVDKAQAQQLVIDLILNAAESYNEGSGAVHIQTGTRTFESKNIPNCIECESITAGKYIFLNITDEGCGIPFENQHKIFEPFVTTKFTGRGLGLSAVRGIVRSHHGGIGLESEPKQGTTISIYFPEAIDSAPI